MDTGVTIDLKIYPFPTDLRTPPHPRVMAGGRNSTTITEFILLGFSEFPQLTAVLFSIFPGIYLATVSWNPGLIVLIRMDSRLHTPMYFFLSNLSLLDTCYVSTIAPRTLSDFFRKHKLISFLGCAMQYLLFSRLGLTECCLLAAMVYARYVAICSPLLYTATMSPSLRADGGRILYNWIPWLIRSVVCLTSAPLLWTKHHQPFLLRPAPTASLILLGHLVLSSHDICAHSHLWAHVCLGYHDILWLHCRHHCEDHFS